MTRLVLLLAALSAAAPVDDDLIGNYTLQEAATAHTLCDITFESDGLLTLPPDCQALLEIDGPLRWSARANGGYRIADASGGPAGAVAVSPDGYRLQLGQRRFRLAMLSASMVEHSPETQAIGTWRGYRVVGGRGPFLCEMDFHPDGTIGLVETCAPPLRLLAGGRWQVTDAGAVLRGRNGRSLRFTWGSDHALHNRAGRITLVAER